MHRALRDAALAASAIKIMETLGVARSILPGEGGGEAAELLRSWIAVCDEAEQRLMVDELHADLEALLKQASDARE